MEKELEKEREIKSFKEVHVELERESALLGKNHDIKDFKAKGDFLGAAGFVNSIATKLYAGIAENSHLFKEYNEKYHGQYKFILTPQLERICEKYNLYVRGVSQFLGDIPEPNIRDLMNFKVHLNDLPHNLAQVAMDVLQLASYKTAMDFSGNIRSPFNGYKISLEEYGRVVNACSFGSRMLDYVPHVENAPTIEKKAEYKRNLQMVNRHEGVPVQIAAVKGLFTEESMQNPSRILNTAEMSARSQVDMDPIVLFPVYRNQPFEQPGKSPIYRSSHIGYLVITAWGDEANDELIHNPQKN